jgi:hypothetical protein
MDHTGANQALALAPLGHPVALQFGDQGAESGDLDRRSDDAGEVLIRWCGAIDRDVPVRLALCCDAQEAHPEALRGERAQGQRRVVAPV